MRALILIFLVMLSCTTYAKKPLKATCEGGNGCIFQISDTDENLPDNAIIVDTKIDGKWERYVTTDMNRTQLDKLYGGDGFTMIYPFNPTFQPTDGQWQVKVGTVTGEICYGQTSNPFKTMLQGMAQAGNVNFPNPFHARFLMNNPNVKWQQIRPDLYKADFGNEYINLKFNVQIIDEKRIEGLFTVTIKVPSKEPCINKIPITYSCIKANERKDPWEDFERPKFDIPRLEDGPKPNVPRLEDDPKPEDDLLPVNPKDELLPVEPGKKSKPNVPKPNVPRLEDKPKAKVERLDN